MELLIKNARLRDKQYKVDIAVDKGIITDIFPSATPDPPLKEKEAGRIIDADGSLVSPSFIDPHLNLDTAFLAGEKEEKMFSRACRAVEAGIISGVTVFRVNAGIDSREGLAGLETISELRKKYRSAVTLQIRACPRNGIIKDPASSKLIKKSLKRGAEVIGCIPQSEYTDFDAREHMDFCFKLAKKFNADLDMLANEDETLSAPHLQYIGSKSLKEKYTGRLAGLWPLDPGPGSKNYEHKIIPIIKKAGINIIINPLNNSLYPENPVLIGRLIKEGVTVAYGQGSIKDFICPAWGRENMLEAGMLAARTLGFKNSPELEILFDMATFNGAKILGLKDYGIKPGGPADFNIINAPNLQEAFRNISECSYVISKGKVIAETKKEEKLFL